MKKNLVLVFIILLLCGFGKAQEKKQQPLTPPDLEKYTYYFDIADNKFSGNGAQFLADELNKNQYVMLGEYHGSARISEFTKALIPLAHTAGFRAFAFEVGPISAEILADLSKDSAKTIENLKSHNSRNAMIAEKGRIVTPVPFFEYVEDAGFLQEAAQRKWNFIGIDQEFVYGYIPLINRLYDNLNVGKKRELKDLHIQVVIQLKQFYEGRFKEEKPLFTPVYESKEIRQFLEKASEKNPRNKEIAAAFIKTNEIYRHNEKQRYWANNSERIAYMKENLRRGMTKFGFNLQKDKMLVKMGAFHMGRGLTPVAQYDLGNTLSELADFNGNRAVNIYFTSRFYINDKGAEVDALTDEKGWLYNFRSLIQMAKKDQWTIIDLRPLRETVFYQRKFELPEQVLDVFRRYDIVMIPKIEIDPKPNYEVETGNRKL